MRYDKLNDKLNEILLEDEKEPLKEENIAVLFDYFNLCGEEYFYYKQRHIHPEAWDAWLKGMTYFYRNKHIKSLWIEELAQNSYYGFDKLLIEQSRVQ